MDVLLKLMVGKLWKQAETEKEIKKVCERLQLTTDLTLKEREWLDYTRVKWLEDAASC